MIDATEQLERTLAEVRGERAAYLALVKRMERLAAEDPKGYRRRVRTLALIGYGYFFALIAACLLGLAWMTRSYLAGHELSLMQRRLYFLLVLVVGFVLRDLWVKIDPPGGMPVARGEAPELYTEVGQIANRLGVVAPDEILLTGDLNAAAVQLPRLGAFGLYRNVLVLGMPLLLALSPDEARAVVAHEFGHFAGRHGRFAVWIYRLGRTWTQFARTRAGQERKGILVEPFIKWFVPEFAATTHALRRAHEFEADRVAAEVAGTPVYAATLVRLAYLDGHLSQAFYGPLNESEALPSRLLEALSKAAREPIDPSRAESRVAEALRQRTEHDDSHPALADRLATLGIEPPIPAEMTGASAADAFGVGPGTGVGDRFETVLRERIEPAWREKRENGQRLATAERHLAESLAELDAQAPSGSLTQEEALRRAELSLLAGREDAEAQLRSMKDNARAALLLGRLLAERNDDEAPRWLRQAGGMAPGFADEARDVLAAYHRRRGEHDQVARIEDEALEVRIRRRQAENHSGLLPTDAVEPFLLTDERRESLRRELASVATREPLQLAYLVVKRLPGTGERRTYLIVFFRRRPIEEEDNSERLQHAVASVVTYPHPVQIEVDQLRAMWVRRLRAMPETLVYDRSADSRLR